MSLSRCDGCDRIIDTDADPECYYHTENQCLCEWCREGRDLQAENRKEHTMTTTILQDATKLKALCDELTVAAAYAAPLPPAKRYQGWWAEEGNSEWAGFAPGDYATEQAAIEAARKAAWGCRGGPRVWACPVEEA